MATDLFAESLFPIGDKPIWSDFRSRNLSVGTRKKLTFSTAPFCLQCGRVVYVFLEGQIRFFSAKSVIFCANFSYYLVLRTWLSVWLKCVCVCVCLPVCLFVWLSVCMSTCLSVCLSVYLSVCLPVCLSVCMSTCLSVCLPAWLCVYLYVCLYVCLSFCLLVCLECVRFLYCFSYVRCSYVMTRS